MCEQRHCSRSGHERWLPERAAVQFWSSKVVPAAQKTVISPPKLLISNTELKGRRGQSGTALASSVASLEPGPEMTGHMSPTFSCSHSTQGTRGGHLSLPVKPIQWQY